MSLAILSSCSIATFEAVDSFNSSTYFVSEVCISLKASRKASTSRLFTSGNSMLKLPWATSLAAVAKRANWRIFFLIRWELSR